MRLTGQAKLTTAATEARVIPPASAVPIINIITGTNNIIEG